MSIGQGYQISSNHSITYKFFFNFLPAFRDLLNLNNLNFIFLIIISILIKIKSNKNIFLIKYFFQKFFFIIYFILSFLFIFGNY